MTMVSSGLIALAGTGTSGGNNQSVEVELGGNGSTLITMNDTNVRNLAGISSGTISLSSFYGKSAFSGPYWIIANALGTVYRSTNGVGTSWNSGTSVLPSAGRIATANPSTPYYILGDQSQNIWSSSDASTWTQHALTSTSGTPVGLIDALGICSNGYILIGDTNGNLWYSNSTPTLAVITGLSYTISSNAIVGQIYYVNLSGTNYYAVADSKGNALLSTNIVSWNTYSTGTVYPTGVGGSATLTYGNGYLAIGSTSNNTTPSVFYSSNGTSWNAATLPSGVSGNAIYTAYGNSTFMAVDNTGRVYTTGSNPSTGWSYVTSISLGANGPVYNLAYGNGVFLLLANNGYVWQTANNGATWTSVGQVGTVTSLAVAY